MVGIFQLKQYYRKMETAELKRERFEIEQELAEVPHDAQLKTALGIIYLELSVRLNAGSNAGRHCQSNSQSVHVTHELISESGTGSAITIDSLPAEMHTMSAEQRMLYLSIVISVCRSGGLSERGTHAIKNWMETVGIDERYFDLAKCNTKSACDLVPDERARKWLAPYIIRDAIRLASVDGLCVEELRAVMISAMELGCSAADVDDIRDFIELSHEAQEKWPTL